MGKVYGWQYVDSIAMMYYATWMVDCLKKELCLRCSLHVMLSEGKLISSRGWFMFAADGYYWVALRGFCTSPIHLVKQLTAILYEISYRLIKGATAIA
jgi:hypothetical protein